MPILRVWDSAPKNWLHETDATDPPERADVPTYQYICTDCGESLEIVQSFSDDTLTICPHCGGKLRKVFSPVGVVFKGSGFYRTDSRSNGAKTASGESSGASKSGDGESSGAKEPAASKSSSGSDSSGSGSSSDSSSSGSGASGAGSSSGGSGGGSSSSAGSKSSGSSSD